MSPSGKGKTITDPLYGNISLSPIEAQIVSTPAFQRLHNVRQLGLGYLVFPSAGYSRFAHSIGTIVTTDRLLTAIEENQDQRKFTAAERQAFRLAALTHDLGHFPFSHTTEHASKAYYSSNLTSSKQIEFPALQRTELSSSSAFIHHEDAGKAIFHFDRAIDLAFKDETLVSKSDVEGAFLEPRLSNIISSDLDCDRLDYLKRTAHHSGAPYGAVDVDFIISKATLDSEGRFCFDRKALRATDHLLVSRFYDFLQIPYHKTVAALEWSLEESVKIMLRDEVIDLSEAGIHSSINDGCWNRFDDAFLIEKLRHHLHDEAQINEIERDHLIAVLERQPAKLVFSWERLCPWEDTSYLEKERQLKRLITTVADQLGISSERLHIWSAPFKLSKAGPLLQRRAMSDDDASDEEAAELIHILGKGQKVARPLIDMDNSVAKHLNNTKYRVLRVYFLPPNGDEALKQQLRRYFENEMSEA